MKESHKHMNRCMPIGMIGGVIFGCIAGGALINSIGVGMTFGLALGVCVGVFVGRQLDKKINVQIKEFGYTVTSAQRIAMTDQYTVTITDKNGAEKTLHISKAQMDKEKFHTGDVVYLDKNDHIQQAYDKYDKK